MHVMYILLHTDTAVVLVVDAQNDVPGINTVGIRPHAHGLTCLPIVQANQKAPFRLFFFLHSPSP